MARDLTVRVRADVGAYQKAMSAAASSTSQFAQAGLRLQKVGMGISNLGDSLTRKVTLPLGLAGAAAVKMASDFDAAFVKATTLAGISANEVDGLKQSVLELSGETGRAPQELADALFFLSSSGLNAEQSMEALEASAKASAVGLGDTATVADAVSSVMLAYADSGLEAAEATDVLIATAKAGKAEPAEFADQLGRLLPVATNLGVSFQDLGGAFAVLSRAGGPVEQQATQILGVMSSLAKPSRQAEEALKGVGLTVEDLRRSIAERGLPETLKSLRDQLGDSGFRLVFDDIRALTGALAIVDGDFETTMGIFEDVRDSVGETENAFSRWAESMGAKNAQAFAQFQVALIQVGEVLAPIASDVLGFVSKIVEAFSNLPGPVQTAIIAFAGFAAALGPILSVSGRLITVTGTVIRLLEGLALPAGAVAGAFNGTSAAATGLVSSLGAVGMAARVAGGLLAVALTAELIHLNNQRFPGIQNIPRDVEDIVTAVGRMNEAGAGNQEAIVDWSLAVGDLDDAMAKLLETSPGLADDFIRSAEAAGIPAEKIRDLQDQLEEHRGAVSEATAAEAEWQASLDGTAGALEGTAEAAKTATEAAQEYLDALRAQFDPQFAMIDALRNSAAAQTELRDATAALAEARAGGDVDAIAEAETRYAEAVAGARSSVIDLHGAAVTLKAQMEEGGLTAADVAHRFAVLAQQQGFTAEETKVMAAAFGIGTAAADTLGATDPNVAVSETGTAGTVRKLGSVTVAANGIPGSKTVTVTAQDNASGTIYRIQSTINSLSGKTVTVSVVASYTASASNALQTFGGRQQSGGRVYPGKWYITGEAGPELFVPDSTGTIIPNHQLGTAPTTGGWGGGGGGGAATIVNVTVHGSVIAERELVSTINRQLSRGTINKNGRAL